MSDQELVDKHWYEIWDLLVSTNSHIINPYYTQRYPDIKTISITAILAMTEFEREVLGINEILRKGKAPVLPRAFSATQKQLSLKPGPTLKTRLRNLLRRLRLVS